MSVAAEADEMLTGQENPTYREGLAYLQGGKWQDAIRSFEAVLRQYPDSRPAQQALNEARFKATIDAKSHVRAKRWIVPWRALIFRLLIIILIVFTAVAGFRLVSKQFAPALAQAQTLRQQKQLLADGNARLEAGDLDTAEARYTELLAQVPDHPEAQQGLAEVKKARELDVLYERAVGFQQAGQYDLALNALTELSVQSPAYRDVNLRIAEIKKRQEVDQLFAGAEADTQAGRDQDAVAKYEQIKALNATYQSEPIANHLFDLYMRLGNGLVAGTSPVTEDVPAAAEYFSKALALQPRNAQAELEHRLANLYLAAQADYGAAKWERAASQFEAIYAQRPDYLGGKVISPLYDVYIRNGDAFLAGEDCGLAYEQFRKAGALPVPDRSLAVSRLDETRPCLTPTPTPSITPTPTLLPTLAPYVPPTPIPTGTPPPPLATFRNQIVFTSANEQKPGFWVMNPDGSNARYLGDSDALKKQYDALLEKYKISPDGRYHVYVEQGEAQDSPQLFIQAYEKNQYGNLDTWQVTQFEGLNYDPAWAPDGSRIAYVSTHQGTDDLWVINPDGTNAWNYTPNKWEWDKRPSWSPDSKKIVFWSNREGTKQIFTIDANGQNLKKIHAVTWDEYDPIWIR
jgi:outer membrane protein assembly factor BamD (BamD/ComL family)